MLIFVNVSVEFNNNQVNVSKRAKLKRIVSEHGYIRQCANNYTQIMEIIVNQKTAPGDVCL